MSGIFSSDRKSIITHLKEIFAQRKQVADCESADEPADAFIIVQDLVSERDVVAVRGPVAFDVHPENHLYGAAVVVECPSGILLTVSDLILVRDVLEGKTTLAGGCQDPDEPDVFVDEVRYHWNVLNQGTSNIEKNHYIVQV